MTGQGGGLEAPGGFAALRRARAERLQRLRAAAAPEGDPAAPGGDPAALADFLRVLRAAAEGPPPDTVPAKDASQPAAAVLPFQRSPDRAPEGASERTPESGAEPVANAAPEPAPTPAAEPAPEPAPGRPRPGAARAAAADLGRLPGAGPGLVWALERAGIARLADLAEAAPEALAERLGPAGALIDLAGWIRFARAAAADRTAVPSWDHNQPADIAQ